jgi:hypothetical protein
MLKSTRREAWERARTEARQTKEWVRAELGQAVVDVIEEYFLEQMAARRGRNRWSFLIAGFQMGVYITRRLSPIQVVSERSVQLTSRETAS